MRLLSVCSSLILLLTMPFASQAIIGVTPTPLQGPDVSRLVPPDLSFATAFVQTLSDSGWSIQAVRYSKFNGGMLGTTKAAWVKTDKGTLEVLFFEKSAEVEQIQIKEEEDSTPSYHKYTVTSANDSHPWEGRSPVYFTKYRTMLVITHESKLNDAINRLVADQIRSAPGRI